MASITYYLDSRKPRKDGTSTLKLRVSHQQRSFLISLDVYILPNQWDADRDKIKSHPRDSILNPYIKGEYNKVENKLLELRASGELDSLSIKELKERIEGRPKSAGYTFAQYALIFIESRHKESTKAVYTDTLRVIGGFCNIDTLRFRDITMAWLRDLDRHMSENGRTAVNARAIVMRSIRAIFNDAINNDVIGMELYPFRKFKIKHEATAKRSLSAEDLRILRDYPCEPWLEKWRDIFMLILYLGGINVVDLLNLRKIHNGRIEYRRSKTGRLYSIKVEPEAMVIIDKYRGGEHLLIFGDKYTNHKDFISRLNANLKKIGPLEMVTNRGQVRPVKNSKKYISLFPGISSYWARHSLATIAASLDVPKETIAAILGHGGNSVTDIYIDFDRRKIDDANRKVIDYLNSACAWFQK